MKLFFRAITLQMKIFLINKPIKEIRKSEKIKDFIEMEGRFDFCQGCTVNCYFEPSFAFPTNLYAISSLTSKFKYSYNKLIKQKIKKKFIQTFNPD